MKNLSATAKYALIATTVLGIAACATFVKDEARYVTILPDMKVSKRDCAAINAILSKFDKSLYEIRSYENGKVVHTHGKLADEYIEEGLSKKVAEQASATHFNGCAMQAGLGSSTKGSSTHPTKDMIEKSQELVARLKPILDKYHKR